MLTYADLCCVGAITEALWLQVMEGSYTPAYVRIRQHTSAYVSTRLHTSGYVRIRQHTSAYVSIRPHTSAYVSIRQNIRPVIYVGGPCNSSLGVASTYADVCYVSIRQHTSAYVRILEVIARSSSYVC